jgi:hypothetical protein
LLLLGAHLSKTNLICPESLSLVIDPLFPSTQSLYFSPPFVTVLHLTLAIKCLLPEPVLIVLAKDEASLGAVAAISAKAPIKPKAFLI